MSVASILNSIAQAHPMADGPYVVRCNMQNGSALYLRQEGTSIRFVARNEATVYADYGKADNWASVLWWDRTVLYALPAKS